MKWFEEENGSVSNWNDFKNWNITAGLELSSRELYFRCTAWFTVLRAGIDETAPCTDDTSVAVYIRR